MSTVQRSIVVVIVDVIVIVVVIVDVITSTELHIIKLF